MQINDKNQHIKNIII